MKLKKTVIIAGFCTVLILILLAKTYTSIDRTLTNEVSQRMEEYAETESMFIKYLFDQELKSLRAGAAVVSDNPSYSREDVVFLLTELRKTTHFYRILVATPDGVSITDADQLSNVSQRDYFASALAGKETVSERMSFLDGTNMGIVMAVPIYRNGAIVGVLVGAHTQYSFDDVFSAQVFGGEAYCLLVDDDGSIILHTSVKNKLIDTDNVFTFYERVHIKSGVSSKQIQEQIALNKEGSFQFSYGKEKRLVYYKPLGLHDWVVLSSVSPDTAFRANRYVYLFITTQIILLAAIFVILLVYYLTTFRKKNALLTAYAQSREIINHAIPGGVIKTDMTDGFSFLYKSQGFYELTGYTEEEIAEQFSNKFINFIHPDDRVQIMEDFDLQLKNGSYVLQYRFCTKNGYIWLYDSGRITSDSDGVKVVISVLIDMTRVKLSIDALQASAEHDSATGLYNKVSTRKYIETILMGSNPGTDLHALILMDIDKFKQINDTYGHQTGDEVLVRISDVLKTMFRKTDVVGRVGGDEFMVLVAHVPDLEFIREMLRNMNENIRGITLKDGYQISCSLGAALYPIHGDRFDTLYERSDNALYRAKQLGRDCFELYEDK